MTPFGARLRNLRAERGMTLKDMAAALGLSAAYLSALEHGHRGQPGSGLILEICGILDLDWEDEESLKELAQLSKPKVTLDTGGLNPEATLFANELAGAMRRLQEHDFKSLREYLKALTPKKTR
ncbi:MAG: helix-turn-helix domain-containing protein [Magnetovibrionaceae bacterium]